MRIRIISACLAMLLATTLLIRLETPAMAAVEPIKNGLEFINILDDSGSELSSPIRYDDIVTLIFDVTMDATTAFTLGDVYYATPAQSSIGPYSSWRKTSSTELSIEILEQNSSGHHKLRVKLENVQYRRTDRKATSISISSLTYTKINTSTTVDFDSIGGQIPESAFNRMTSSGNSGGGSSSGDDDPLPTTDILIEAVRVYDKNNKQLTKITEETDPFNVEIIYSDYGVIWEVEHFDDKRYEAYVTELGGFNIPTSRGTLSRIVTISTNEAPRFRVVFSNVTYKEGGANTLGFRVHYDYYGDVITGKASAQLAMVESKDDDKEENTKELPATPHIILLPHSYGGEAITAGEDFTLNISYKNTSSDIALENIIMTVTPKSEHVIALSNTFFVSKLAANGTLSNSIELSSLATAGGLQNVDIGFKYEYVIEKDSKTKERRTGENTASVAVPFVQLDRFTVDPIPENTDYTQLGEQFFMSVSFVNEGKSPIYNVSATARGTNREIFAGVSRMDGVLQASANNELEIDIICGESGELQGEIIISYEDESMNRREIILPFTKYIEEPYIPQKDFPGNIDHGLPTELAGPVLSTPLVVSTIAGCAMIAAALSRYIAKRVIAKEKEEADEDF